MDENAVTRLGLILAKQAEIEGMKALNYRQKARYNAEPLYGQNDFDQMAIQLEFLSTAAIEDIIKSLNTHNAKQKDG